jgi:hypothetical protein
MALTTYTELKAAIATWIDYTTLTTEIVDFVTLAEKRLKRDLRTREMIARATATMLTTGRYLGVPSDFVAVKQFQINTDPLRTLQFVTEDVINQFNSSTSGKPYYFTVTGDEFQFEKTPDSAYTAEITYYKLTPLSGAAATNEIFPEYPELYLHATLVEAYGFLMDGEKMGRHEQMYQRYLQDAMDHDRRSRISDGELIRMPDTIE